MDCTINHLGMEETVQAPIKTSPRRRGSKAANAAALVAEAVRAQRIASYEAFATSLRNELRPQSSVEAYFVDLVILKAWQLAQAIEAGRASLFAAVGGDSRDLFDRMTEVRRQQTDRIEQSIRVSLKSLQVVRTALQSPYKAATKPVWGRAIKLDTKVVPIDPEPCVDNEIFPNEWTIVPDDHFAQDATDSDAPLPRWQDRLLFDPNVSDRSPVIKGTWITVSQIVSRIVDGFTWADILRSHPELTEEDIRICLSYATEQESDESKDVYLP